MSEEDKARKTLQALTERIVTGYDYSLEDSKGVAVAMLFKADGTMEMIGHREFYAYPDAIDTEQDKADGVYRMRPSWFDF